MRASALLWSLTASLAGWAGAADMNDVMAALQHLEGQDIAALLEKAQRQQLYPAPPPPKPQPHPRDPSMTLPPTRPQTMSRLVKPWGDGFVRLPVQRHVFNDTRLFRTGRMRRPNKGNYPAPVNGTNGTSTTAPPSGLISSRDTPGTTVDGGPAKPGWGWSHLDDYQGLAYMIQLEIGTPPQRVMVTIDTGSYELWVNPRCIASPDPPLCGTYGHYYPQLSNTSSSVGGAFKVVYGTGEAAGEYYSDMIRVAMFSVPSVQFAVASDTNYTYSGVLGLGYTYPFTTKYPTLLSMMWALGFVAAPVFSMGLGGEGDGFSEIIFGGVNRWKFSGPLEPVSIWPPIDKQDPSWLQYWVNVTSIGMTPPGERSRVYTDLDTFNMPMLIDSGSTLSYIREDVVRVLANQLAAMIDSQGNYWVDCKLRNQNGTIDIGFNRGKMVVTVRYKDFIWEQSRNRCLMGFQAADPGSTNYVLGDTFIRGAYLVFDQQSDVVWIADYYNCGDGVAMVGERPADTQYVRGQC